MSVEATQLTEGMAKIASGSILVTALFAAVAAFSIKSNKTWFKALTILVMAGVLVVAIVLFSANERVKTVRDEAAVIQARECAALLAQVKQGLRDKLLPGDVSTAKQIAEGLLRDIEASDCKPRG